MDLPIVAHSRWRLSKDDRGKGDVLEQIHGDTIWNDDIPETSDEESEENEGIIRVKLPKARLVDVEQ